MAALPAPSPLLPLIKKWQECTFLSEIRIFFSTCVFLDDGHTFDPGHVTDGLQGCAHNLIPELHVHVSMGKASHVTFQNLKKSCGSNTCTRELADRAR